ncbi:MAG: UDP-3-O-(3-hydroxymyristoyl)glucosamine N-acyltransferase [Bacteroidetes bacterium]|jgi:UDP-3-O-[3-hydroxymyristoyl] glucosamine N-acyltransferase|nr:UDP-3-O-(3-hydroxymyristoyl)glucosamine N-acyltransferase [Bacteroidota bacterium]MBT3750081.1 UDP-3-O-(3-hydroxymyristoyl)glucosamine N-acyltransferase [Bacteroidota bacterium]MBT4402178.1 UDP-3-O-(3-hydroxymyristoyl)glucosamine N-acyltransferase [Bacteroidota bacterium]MBT4411667.1 UDP-3-O-(3-hydroxymyristoyl)glucosamine N-acyltransferase [Bacteroidota bacterium]MBT5424618.1 UDP-3-O-(3-hydroxymyristoyl)glucosamine N-acyltransferase [Bacteroidota bacterium]
MKFTAQRIAEILGGTVHGDPNVEVSDISRIEDGKPGTLSFLANNKYLPHLFKTQASVVLVSENLTLTNSVSSTLIKVKDPYGALAKLLTLVEQTPDRRGLEQPCYVSPEAKLGKDVYVGAFSYIGKNTVIGDNVLIFPNTYISENVSIGDETVIYSGAKIHHNSEIGSKCILHSGVVIGGDGFGFAPSVGSDYAKVPQVGNVILEDQVEIGSNSTIDRATIGSTIIRKGVKLDNLIQIAHNVEIGEDTIIAAQTGVSGSTKIGRNCMIGGQVGIIGHIQIADKTRIAAQSGVGQSLTREGVAYQGSPCFEVMPYQRSYVLFRKLPELYDRIRHLEEEIKNYKTGSLE